MTLLGANETFAATCVAMEREHVATPADMGAMLARWLSDGLIVGLDQEPTVGAKITKAR